MYDYELQFQLRKCFHTRRAVYATCFEETNLLAGQFIQFLNLIRPERNFNTNFKGQSYPGFTFVYSMKGT